MGCNWQLQHVQAAPFNDGALMRRLMPGANVVRVVGVLWDNSGSREDCMTDTPPHYFREGCFAALDNAVRQATGAGLWVVLAARAVYAAGQNYIDDPGADVFHNATLRRMFGAMWRHVAGHYASWDRIGAYEARPSSSHPCASQG